MAPLRRPTAVTAVALLLAAASWAQQPNRTMLSEPLRFTGPDSQATTAAGLDEVRIGLFLPADPADPVAAALQQGARLAVEQANAAGGLDGRPFRLVRRWATDPWRAGSQEVVRLAYQDRVWVVVGGADSASTHVAQQVATKGHFPLIVPISSDPSLTHTRVPWVFRLAPDDKAQARLLAAQALLPRKLHRPGLVTSTAHDGRTASVELLDQMQRHHLPPAFHLSIDPAQADPAVVAARIAAFRPDGLVADLPPGFLRVLASELARQDVACPLFLPWLPGLGAASPLPYPGETVLVEPFDRAVQREGLIRFEGSYRRRFCCQPQPEAAYAFDAVTLAVHAIRMAGPSRSRIRDALAAASGFEGATGTIHWDNGGGNLAIPVLRHLPTASVRAVRHPDRAASVASRPQL